MLFKNCHQLLDLRKIKYVISPIHTNYKGLPQGFYNYLIPAW